MASTTTLVIVVGGEALTELHGRMSWCLGWDRTTLIKEKEKRG